MNRRTILITVGTLAGLTLLAFYLYRQNAPELIPGLDANQDGIRDDVEKRIEEKYSYDPKVRIAVRELPSDLHSTLKRVASSIRFMLRSQMRIVNWLGIYCAWPQAKLSVFQTYPPSPAHFRMRPFTETANEIAPSNSSCSRIKREFCWRRPTWFEPWF